MIALRFNVTVMVTEPSATEEGVQSGPVRSISEEGIKKGIQEAIDTLQNKGYSVKVGGVALDVCWKN